MSLIIEMCDVIKSQFNHFYYYSPYCFLKPHDPLQQVEKFVIPLIQELPDESLFKFTNESQDLFLAHRYLEWDSTFFKIPTYKILIIANTEQAPQQIIISLKQYLSHLKQQHEKFYVWLEVPSEDIHLIQALNQAGFCLVETRLCYFNDKIQSFTSKRYPVREAIEADIPLLKKVASETRNSFDRFHADQAFSQEVADQYLATFIEQSIHGFAHVVLVPDLKNQPSSAFMTADFVKEVEDLKLGKMVLSAVAPECRGWYVKLVSETTYYFQEKGMDCVMMTTQSTNRVVVKTWEKMGYHFGRCTHIFSFSPHSI